MSDDFYKHLTDHYRKRCNAEREEASMLWNVTLSLLAALRETESDGSGIAILQELGVVHAKNLRAYLEGSGQ